MNGKHLSNEEKLEAIYEMTAENNHMIKSLQRQQYFTTAVRIFYWLVVLGALGGAYYYVRPFVSMITGNGGKIEEGLNQLEMLKNTLPETKVLNQVIEGLHKSAAATVVTEEEELEGFEVAPATTTP